ncbi:MAG TPA: FlgD immunoglobulin-like domain containing protein, partial [Candidatus Syntrophosphaera sp.]|nr:FlgD immunoglobulin-like domain containing protein [Candidatus Syntrophosphaera sp.]
WTPQFSGNSYFISPAYDTAGETTIYLDFKHFVDFYTTPFTLGVATRSGGGAWNTVWSVNPSANIGPVPHTVTIANTDVGASDFQFAFYYSGNSYNIDYWYIDNVKLYKPWPYDLAVMDSGVPGHVEAGTPVIPSCTVKNAGLNPLTATVSLSIYRGTVLEYSQPDYYSAYLNSLETDTATFPGFTPALADELYRFEFSISSLEDVVDDDPANNQFSAYTNTWTGSKQMVVLEIGTGGWCPYCPGAAMAADDFIDGGYAVAVIENHNGDPYANDCSNARNTYYGISGYPTGFFDGVLSYVGGNNSTSVFPSYLPLFQQRITVKTPLYMDIYGEETRENYEITVRIDKFAPLPYPNTVLHLAVTESEIMYAWQGQDHLNFVNRWMFPSWEGLPIDLVNQANGSFDIVQTITKDPSWVTAHCELVAFIQNLDSKEIIQANKVALPDLMPPVALDDPAQAPAVSALDSVSPNPFSGQLEIGFSLKDGAPVSLRVYNTRGQLVRTLLDAPQAAGRHSSAWDGRNDAGQAVASGAYVLRLQSGSEVSTRKVMLIK